MNIGDKIKPNNEVKIEEIINIVPVAPKDDGTEEWYEVCDANNTDYIAIIGRGISSDGNSVDSTIIMKRSERNIEILSDII